MIVVDTNVLVYAVRPGLQTEAALRAKRLEPDWVAPPFWRLEMRNVLAMSMRVDKMELSTAVEAFTAAESLVDDLAVDTTLEEALLLADRASISAYDAEFVLAAEQLGVPLVTADRRLVNACPGRAVALADFPSSQ